MYFDEIGTKLTLLTECDKFHNEIIRCFLLKLVDIKSSYYDKKRRIEYFRIMRMIEQENKSNPNQPKKKTAGEEPKDSATQKPGRQISNVLNDITEVSRKIDKIKIKLNYMKFNVRDLQLLPSNREQDQLERFLNFSLKKNNQNRCTLYKCQNQYHQNCLLNYQRKNIKQVLPRKMITQESTQIPYQTISSSKTTKQQSLYQQPSQIQSSPTININNYQIESFTQRAIKENVLSKLLSS